MHALRVVAGMRTRVHEALRGVMVSPKAPVRVRRFLASDNASNASRRRQQQPGRRMLRALAVLGGASAALYLSASAEAKENTTASTRLSVVVIGGGVCGLWTGLSLARLGHQVT